MKSYFLPIIFLCITLLLWQCKKDENSSTGNCPNCPTITSIEPSEGSLGDTICIKGMNFDRFGENDTGSVTINGVEAIFIELVSSTEIKVEVPSDATTGEVIICALTPNDLYDNVLCNNQIPDIIPPVFTIEEKMVGNTTNL